MFNFGRAAGLGAVAALALGVSVATVEAATVDVYASGSSNVVGGTNAGVIPARSNVANAYGAADGKFYSLGLGGTATFTFAPAHLIGSPGNVVEITNGVRDGHVESIAIYGILGMVETFLGNVTNTALSTAFTFTGSYTALKFVDTSVATASQIAKGRDGFDIDSITVAAVPLPAGGLLLLGALGGIAGLRRRKA